MIGECFFFLLSAEGNSIFFTTFLHSVVPNEKYLKLLRNGFSKRIKKQKPSDGSYVYEYVKSTDYRSAHTHSDLSDERQSRDGRY